MAHVYSVILVYLALALCVLVLQYCQMEFVQLIAQHPACMLQEEFAIIVMSVAIHAQEQAMGDVLNVL